MRKTKFMAMLVAAVMVVGAVAGCGNKSSGKAKEVSANEKPKVSSESKETTRDAVDAAMQSETTGEAVTPTDVANAEVTQSEAPAPDKAAEPGEAPKSSKSDSTAAKNASAKSKSSNSGGSVASNTHTHAWKEHVVSEQVWVPNIVTVDDYEEQTVKVHDEYLQCCNCGAIFYNDDDLIAHIKKSVEDTAWFYTPENIEAINNGTLPVSAAPKGCNNHLIIPAEYKTEYVKVGSHEEDHGHYETKTHVDYYYCDCGARK